MGLKEHLRNIVRSSDESVREKRLEVHHVTAKYTGKEGDVFKSCFNCSTHETLDSNQNNEFWRLVC